MAQFTLLGVSDEITTCERCGKKNLKRTVVLEGEAGGLTYMGTTCAAKALKGVSKSSIDTAANAYATVNRWMAKGYDAKTIAKGIWNKFGYLSDVRGNVLKFDWATFVFESRE